ncbi:Fe-S cluster assembly iron-binding protein IscA [Symbiobacterium terraclitae]|uniref:Fe-S cluster assembly iron-binding protein IscA n=1 Tax=Symbiobacterium terraclitae TaxID=557451 RepID=A0ABS4JU04_9FIRM|nr:hypothetical protein [Symbiobacterium terraclitae]MBP2019013.1 Fe-S cluster assembly iron-binding protein IscA [Symbiobacterium terraclitae]
MFSFTPQAAQKLNAIMQEKGGNLALCIEIDSGPGGGSWRLTLVERSPAALVVDGVPVQADSATLRRLDGLVIDWVLTPDGPGLGVYDRNLLDGEARQARRF